MVFSKRMITEISLKKGTLIFTDHEQKRFWIVIKDSKEELVLHLDLEQIKYLRTKIGRAINRYYTLIDNTKYRRLVGIKKRKERVRK